jgi:hypothetical protein
MTMPEPIEDVEHSFVTGRDLRPWLGDDLLENSVMQDARGPGLQRVSDSLPEGTRPCELLVVAVCILPVTLPFGASATMPSLRTLVFR